MWQVGAVQVIRSTDATPVIERAGAFLDADPLRCNVIGTLLRARAAHPEAGRYWMVLDDEATVLGVVFQSPLDFPATITPMPAAAVDAVVDAIATDGARFPGVGGEAGTAARFAGAWTERTSSAAVPFAGQRIYEAGDVHPPTGVGGRLRPATGADRDRLIAWTDGFIADTGEPAVDSAALVDHRLPLGHFWVWDHDGAAVSMAALSDPAAGVVRVQAVYTPHDQRGRGYASACVAALTEYALVLGHRCMLYTDLGNPTSNGIYRAIGYRAVAEVLRYRFVERDGSSAGSS